MVKDQVSPEGKKIKGFTTNIIEIGNKLLKIKYKKLKGLKAVSAEFEDLINGGGTN